LADIAKEFNVSAATMSTKSREIQDALFIIPLDPRFCLPENLPENPIEKFLEMTAGHGLPTKKPPTREQEHLFPDTLPLLADILKGTSPSNSGKKKNASSGSTKKKKK